MLYEVITTFAHENPRTYLLAYSTQDAALRPDPAELAEQVLPVQQIVA